MGISLTAMWPMCGAQSRMHENWWKGLEKNQNSRQSKRRQDRQHIVTQWVIKIAVTRLVFKIES